MLDTYIKNRGSTKTIIHDNHHNNVNEMKWNANYDGDIAKISLDLKNNGKAKHYNIKLDNSDLAKILNIDSVDLPIDKRLKRDFKKVRMERQPRIYDIYLEDLIPPQPQVVMKEPLLLNNDTDIMSFINDDLIQTAKPVYSHISSPEEELLIPLTIDKDSEKSYVLTPRKHHVKPRTHKTYRVYKHKKATSSKNSKAKGKKSRSHRKTSNKSIKNSLKEYFNI
jgi:hypothetical protein